MKILFKIILLLVLLSQISCSDANEPKIEEGNVNSYFPLSIGNKWYYKSWNSFDSSFVYPDNIMMTEEVISSHELGDKLFYLVETCHFNLNGIVRAKDSVYYNFSNDTLFQILNDWEFSNQSLSIRAIFSDTGSVNYKMRWYDQYYEAHSRFETDTTMNFVFYQPLVMDSGFEWKFKKDVGISDYISYQTNSLKLVKYELF